MKDIGFGLIDRRTVIIVLFTLVLANVIFGYQIPVDIQNVGNLFIGLIVLTGYIYLARTIYRLPVALVFAILVIVKDTKSYQKRKNDGNKSQTLENKRSSFLRKFVVVVAKSIIWVIRFVFVILPLYVFFTLSIIFTFEDTKEHEFISYMPAKINYSSAITIQKVFRILDRIGIVCIAALATIPYFSNLVKIIGVGGLLAMVVIFTFRGDFTALIKDALEVKEDDNKKDKEKNMFENESTINIKNSSSNPIYVQVVNTREHPIKIENDKYNPFHITTDYKDPLCVDIVKGALNHLDYPFPVYVVNKED